jgi:hypothetical protein
MPISRIPDKNVCLQQSDAARFGDPIPKGWKLHIRAAVLILCFSVGLPGAAAPENRPAPPGNPPTPMATNGHRLVQQQFISITDPTLVCPNRTAAVVLLSSGASALVAKAVHVRPCKRRRLYGRIEEVLDRRSVARPNGVLSPYVAFRGYQNHPGGEEMPIFGVVSEDDLNAIRFTPFESWQKNFAPVRGLFRAQQYDSMQCRTPKIALKILGAQKAIETRLNDQIASEKMERLLKGCTQVNGTYRPVALLAQWRRYDGALWTALTARNESGKIVALVHRAPAQQDLL